MRVKSQTTLKGSALENLSQMLLKKAPIGNFHEGTCGDFSAVSDRKERKYKMQMLFIVKSKGEGKSTLAELKC
ncbi:hypothetical protein L596_003650 [Steinernema carpocapsae]|uniref:Uncharacterized protein n=1 Tax=Steinernema carpocapsae TaxID=34508 RepID=A0A4U8UT42_STECR|nr:hypothetical protein L596_003650 [Steinernema carpocapsae]